MVSAEKYIPEMNRTDIETAWKCLKIEGPLDFSLTGILASLTISLAEAGISIFAISTYDTDYILIKDNKMDRAIRVLADEGHEIGS
ncbi:ACT domain-containing protein [Paenibacillus alkalitolerans]|uniref:ACT domain-containing protein n=1 Tax=Paenibacillus alkalitolerans TaxID=2799335 RepID=UPI003898E16A